MPHRLRAALLNLDGAAGAARSQGVRMAAPKKFSEFCGNSREVPTNSSRLSSRSGAIELSPVMFAPGCATLGTMPVPTGLPTAIMTRGTVDVAFLTANIAGVPAVTITSTDTASNSPTSAGNRW
jgi:hypothetical protein